MVPPIKPKHSTVVSTIRGKEKTTTAAAATQKLLYLNDECPLNLFSSRKKHTNI